MSVMLIDALSARRGGGQTYLRNLLIRLPPAEPSQIYVLARPELEAELAPDRVRVVQPKWPMHNGLLLSIQISSATSQFEDHPEIVRLADVQQR